MVKCLFYYVSSLILVMSWTCSCYTCMRYVACVRFLWLFKLCYVLVIFSCIIFGCVNFFFFYTFQIVEETAIIEHYCIYGK